METPPRLHKISVIWRGKKFVLQMNSGATVKELGQELQKLTNIQEDTMRLIIPQVSNKASKLMSPFSTEHAFISLQEASITEAKSIKMMGVSTNEVEQVLQDAKANLRIAGFEDEEKRLKQRSSHGPNLSLKLPQGPYIFGEFITLELPGVKLNPPPSEALKRMHMLAADPGIVAVMNKHRWRVGIMTEMAPIGYVGVSPKCILGLNKNHGEEISLRLRTDDLRGFRKYESIKKTLLHELAHMVYSEHDANFYALDKQLNQEAASLDWTRSAGHTLSGVRNSDYFEEDSVRDSGNIPQKLGGNRSDQLMSACAYSVAAAYHRMINASAKMAGGSEANDEPDPDDSSFNASDETDHMNSKSKEMMDIDMTFHAKKGPKSEPDPDPDDHLAYVMRHEPDPDDSHHVKAFSSDVCPGIPGTDLTFHAKKGPNSEPDPDDHLADVMKQEPDPDDSHHVKALRSNVCSGIIDTDMIFHAEKGLNSEPDPDDHLAIVMKHEPDPDDSHHVKGFRSDVCSGITDTDKSEVEKNNLMHNSVVSDSLGSVVTIKVGPQVIESRDSNETAHKEPNDEVVVLAEPDPDDIVVPPRELSTMQTDEPDPDDQELQRINDPVTIVCNRLQKTLEVLRAEVSPMQTSSVLQTLLKIIRNVIEHPEETKYKRLRKANPVIERNVVNNKAALEILFLVGFKEDVMLDELGKAEAYIVLKRSDPGLLWLAKSSLESCTNLKT